MKVALIFDVAHPSGLGVMVPMPPAELSDEAKRGWDMALDAMLDGRERVPLPLSLKDAFRLSPKDA